MLINPKEEIIKALHGYYAEIPIYAEEIKQGFKAPCFFVQQLKLTQKDGLQNYYERKADFDILYFAQDETNEALETMGAELAEKLIFLPEPKLRGSNIAYRVVDKTLHFLVTYQTRIKETKTYAKMGSLTEEVIAEDGSSRKDKNEKDR